MLVRAAHWRVRTSTKTDSGPPGFGIWEVGRTAQRHPVFDVEREQAHVPHLATMDALGGTAAAARRARRALWCRSLQAVAT